MKDKRVIIQDFMNGPTPYAGELLQELSPGQTFKKYAPRTRFDAEVHGQHNCFLIREGVVNVCAEPNDRVIGILRAPAILGFITLLSNALNFKIYTVLECEIAVLSKEEAFSIIAKKNLWEVYAKHTEVVANRLYLNNLHITAPTSYGIIRNLIFELINQPDSIRNMITIERYVCEKSQLSRSGVLKILAKLKEGNYIVVEKGMLKSINRLPDEF